MPFRYVYEIVNTVNGHTYVGQRTCECSPELDDYWGSGLLIKRAIKKYGPNCFTKRILEVGTFDKKILDACEKHWIAVRKAEGHAEYNIAPGGTGGDLLKNDPERKKVATQRRITTCHNRPPEKRAAIGIKMAAINKAYWANLPSEKKARIGARRSELVTKSYEDPAFYAWKCAFNAKNGPIQSQTQNSKEWIEATGKDAHSRQNIHIAAGFFMDLDGKLYTRKALVTVLGCTHRAALAFTANWERRMNRAVYDKWHARFKWIPNTPENDKMYNFERNVITGCYTKKETHV